MTDTPSEVGIAVVDAIQRLLPEARPEWMYPGFVALHFHDGIFACGDGDPESWGWDMQVQTYAGDVFPLPWSPPIGWPLEMVITTFILKYLELRAMHPDRRYSNHDKENR